MDRQRIRVQVGELDIIGYLEFSPSTPTVCEPTSIWWLDCVVHVVATSVQPIEEKHDIRVVKFRPKSPSAFMLESIFRSIKPTPSIYPVEARFLFSTTSGFIIRSDFLEQRFECSQYVSESISFLNPLQYVDGVDLNTERGDFETLIRKGIGLLVLRPKASLSDLDDDIRNRLAIPYLQPNPIPPRRLAWVQGREDVNCIERAFKAAAALGIRIVILDEPGHWLQGHNSPWSYLREEFLEVDITPDKDLAARIVEAVRSYPQIIEGIVTISDVRLPAIARACSILGLPTESAEAYEIAGDKGRTRLLEPLGAVESFVLHGAGELELYLQNRDKPLRFPLVVKPVVGWCSDCVSKVHNIEELKIAVDKASERHAGSAKPSTTVVVEPYIDGPEVDANFVILDGEILFLDINDDFPSPADEKNAGFKANFQETQNVMPSGLPKLELEAIRDQMRDSILRQGFRSGVFHCEARVRNSTFKYAKKDSYITDLVANDENTGLEKPTVYLHENNARPPGYLESVAVLLTYGIDYYALRMLFALGPKETSRIQDLSQPFLRGPQFHLSLMIIQQTQAGIMKTVDAGKEFLDTHPDIKESVVDHYTRKKGGDVLEGPDASALWWIAYFSVISRVSRQNLLERVEYIQRNFAYEIEE